MASFEGLSREVSKKLSKESSKEVSKNICKELFGNTPVEFSEELP